MIYKRRSLILFTALLLLSFVLSGCTTMEEKRDRYLAHGIGLYQQGDYLRARLEFKNALEIDQSSAKSSLWLGKAELKLNNYRGAVKALMHAVELEPGLTEGQILLGEILLVDGKLADAASRIKLALDQQPKNPEGLLLSASLAAAENHLPQAVKILQEVRRLHPDLVKAYIMQSAIEARQGQLAAAAATLAAGIKVNPQAMELYLAQAELADSQKRLDQGEKALLQAVALQPQNPQLQVALARHYLKAGQLDKVEQTLRHNLTLEPDNEAHALELARFLAEAGKSAAAEMVLSEFARQHPQNLAIRFALADFYLARAQEGRARKMLKEIVREERGGPASQQARNRLARLLLSHRQLAEAQALVQGVLQDNPEDPTAHRLRGLIALERKDGAAAVGDFRFLTQEEPRDPEAWLLLARAQAANQEIRLAKETAQKALEIKPDYLPARHFLYGLFLQKDDYDGAIQTIQAYLKLNDQDLFNLVALGKVYSRKGDYSQARAAFQKVINLAPGNPEGYYQQAQLSLKLNKGEEAVKWAKAALGQQAAYLPALELLVEFYQEHKQPAKAVEIIRQALPRQRHNPQLNLLLGKVLLAQKQPQAAIAPLREALDSNPGQRAAIRLLTAAYQELPDQPQVMRQLEERLADPQAPPYNFLVLAAIYEKQQKFDQAIALYGELIRRDLYPLLARNNLAYLLAEHRPSPENLEKAQQLSLETLEESPEDLGFLDTLGWIYCRQGNFAQGKTYLERAAVQSANPTVLYHLGWCIAKVGDTEKARQALQKALSTPESFPERDLAQTLLQSLSPATPHQ